MSRSGYSDDCDSAELNMWTGAVASAIRGKRGQAMLRELLAALDALPENRLATESLVSAEGEYCALGALGRARGMDMESIDPEDRKSVAWAFGIAEALAAEIMYRNDEVIDECKYIDVTFSGPVRPIYPEYGKHTKTVRMLGAAEKRWSYMREWVASNIIHQDARVKE